MKAFTAAGDRWGGGQSRGEEGSSGKPWARQCPLERPTKAERSGARGGRPRPGTGRRGPSGPAAAKPGGEPRVCGGRRNAERRRGSLGKGWAPREPRERRGAVRARAARGCGARSPPGTGAKPPSAAGGAARSGLGSEGSRRTRRGRGGRGGGGIRKAPLPVAGLLFPGAGIRGIHGQRAGGLRRAPRLAPPGEERARGRLPCPVPGGSACPGAARPRLGAGSAGQAEQDRPAPAAPRCRARSPPLPLPRPPPAPAPELTVLVVLEVVVGAGPAAALGRVLHVVELQKVRPLAREAQEGGSQAPRQGHQPPGAGESRERAEGAAGRAGPGPPLPAPVPATTGGHGARGPAVALPGAAAPPGAGTTAAAPGCGALRRPSGAARERGAAPPAGGGPEAGGTRVSPPHRPPPPRRSPPLPGPGAPRTSAAASRRQKRSARDRAAGRAGREGSGAGEGRKAGAGPAPLRPRLPASSPRSFPGGGRRRDPRSGRAEETRSPSPTYPAGRGLSGRPSASRPRPLRTAGGAQRSCSPALPPARGWKSRERRALKTWPTPRSPPVGTWGRLGSARQAAPFLLLVFVRVWVFGFFFPVLPRPRVVVFFAEERLLERREHDIFAVITDKSPKCFLHCKHVHLNGNHGLAPSVTTSAASSAEPGGAGRRGRRGAPRAAWGGRRGAPALP